ncbi:MAG: glycosyltransferase family 8 protein [Oscillospiraceae bacterium]|nr:glycosyltransferase family 8 protein [Oscillospiraceae bacterium]
MDTISILAALDEHYLPQLHVLLTSLRLNNPGEHIDLYLLQSAVSPEGLAGVERQCAAFGYGFFPVLVDDTLFQGAPVSRQYPKEMYYRLLASRLLPDTLDRVLYLDPDILVLNPLRPLWETDLEGNLFAAAAHTGKTELANSVNRMRLNSGSDYYNSGVLLMDLAAARREIDPEEIFRYVAEHKKELLLPDQDLLNALYGRRILPLDDALWNYDARNYNNYRLRSAGTHDLPWVMEHTAILHFCGKAKPWKPGYVYRFGVLYHHYAQLTRRACQAAGG